MNYGRGNYQGLVSAHQTVRIQGEREEDCDYEEGPNLDGLPAQCACAGDGGAVRTAHARNT